MAQRYEAGQEVVKVELCGRRRHENGERVGSIMFSAVRRGSDVLMLWFHRRRCPLHVLAVRAQGSCCGGGNELSVRALICAAGTSCLPCVGVWIGDPTIWSSLRKVNETMV